MSRNVLAVVFVGAGAPGFEHDDAQTGLGEALRRPAAGCARAHDHGVDAFAPAGCSGDMTSGGRIVLLGPES